MDRALLSEFLHEYPFQPATAFWRALEIEHLLKADFPEGRGLDLGCGDGRLTRIILQAKGPRELVGIDIDPVETQLALESGVYKSIHAFPSDRIPEPDASFDFVLSNSVLEHISRIHETLREVGRLLKPGGRFLFTVPAEGFHACLRGPLLPGRSREQYLSELDRRLAHLRYWSKREWEEALGAAGMKIEQSSEYLDAGQVKRWESISRFTGGVFYQLFRKKKHPAEIQKSLGMRSQRLRVPRLLTVAMATAMALERKSPAQAGCLMVVAVRQRG